MLRCVTCQAAAPGAGLLLVPVTKSARSRLCCHRQYSIYKFFKFLSAKNYIEQPQFMLGWIFRVIFVDIDLDIFRFVGDGRMFFYLARPTSERIIDDIFNDSYIGKNTRNSNALHPKVHP